MADTTQESTIRGIRATVQAIETKLRRGDLPEEGLADLKAAIDDSRLRLWAVISAAGSGEPEAVLLRFRLRRAAEICRGVVADLDGGTLGQHQRELLELREAAREMTRRVDASIRGSG
jgi:uncharacterized protein (DUF433 family)